jgi:putative glycerol-1-phosphate prenyltransferase/phosphoglycerol geranylgeranyltransferase
MIEEKLTAKLKERALFAVLLDPDSSESDAFLETGKMAFESGADLILVGGSLIGNASLPKKVAELKKLIDIPIILFPGGASQVVPGFDAMLFTSLVSGRNPQYLIDEQLRGGLIVKALGIEAFPTAYMLINSGPATAVEYISNTKAIPANKPKLTMAHAIASELMGMRWAYLEAGSGAENPVPLEHIILTRKATNLNIIAGGGITTPQDAQARVKAGANVIVTGTIWEKNPYKDLMKEFAQVIHAGS